MKRDIVQRSDSALDAARIDAIVGSYAAIGAADLRRRRRWTLLLSGCGAALLVAAIWGQPGWLFPFLRTAEFEEFRTSIEERLDGGLGELAGGLGRLEGERSALEAQRAQIDAQLGLLTAQLAEFERQAATWEQRRLDLERQGNALMAAMRAIESERATLRTELANNSQAVASAAEVQVVAEAEAEREALDTLLNELVADGTEVDSELESLRAQREAVEQQREQLQREMAELEALLFSEDADELSARGAPEAVPLGAEPGESMDMDTMRAGIRLGDGMSVSLGLSRSASVNGVDQFADSVSLGDITTGIDWNSVQYSLGGYVMQNGPGNSIGSAALDTVTTGLGTVIQNSLDGQMIQTETIYDVRIEDVQRAIDGINAGQAIDESLRFQQ